MEREWVMVCKRTDDPKLAWINTAEQPKYYAGTSCLPAPKRGWNVRGDDCGWILDNGVSERTARKLADDLNSGKKKWDGHKIR